ncbi:hypothetical protein M427DRAFT_35588 [Gonapodya prolifera JEL478]|uniref:Bud22 domain-containing protein n=1 Tax=Gonapodya prolifera (strain JEL478) TaxID=1344416 RepID=A0A139A495_GONPJ|nr:hypothetical protein M427DRAFT_35588 [Gonapodya prolifera JEL478]|eukprot:KXS11610.1 hypothetical protein M427DRAFT_35588 [Gonapodya prolifera JEL478]
MGDEKRKRGAQKNEGEEKIVKKPRKDGKDALTSASSSKIEKESNISNQGKKKRGKSDGKPTKDGKNDDSLKREKKDAGKSDDRPKGGKEDVGKNDGRPKGGKEERAKREGGEKDGTSKASSKAEKKTNSGPKPTLTIRVTVEVLLPPLLTKARSLLQLTESVSTEKQDPLLETSVAQRILANKMVEQGLTEAIAGKPKVIPPTAKAAVKTVSDDGEDGNSSDAPSFSSLRSFSSIVVGSSDGESDNESDAPPVDDWMDEDDSRDVWGKEVDTNVTEGSSSDDDSDNSGTEKDTKAKKAPPSSTPPKKTKQGKPGKTDQKTEHNKGDGGKKKNRMGQKARRLLYQQMYGDDAKLKPLPDKGPVKPEEHSRGDTPLTSKGGGLKPPTGTAAKRTEKTPAVAKRGKEIEKPKKVEDKNETSGLHPSWAAKISQKKAEEARKAAAGTAKKLVFGDE